MKNKSYITRHVSYKNNLNNVLHERCKKQEYKKKGRKAFKKKLRKQKPKLKDILTILNREKHQMIPLKKLHKS